MPLDQRTEGVPHGPGLVEEVLAGGVAAVLDELVARSVQRRPQLRDGDLAHPVGARGVPGQVADDLADGSLGRRPERHVLRADQTSDQQQPAGEHHRRAALRLRGGQPGPVVAQRPEVQRVDPRRQAVTHGVRLHSQRPAQRLVLVLDVTQDQRAVAEGHLPQGEHLDRAGLPATGRPEEDHVRVGDTGDAVQRPADRIGVESAVGEVVDAQLRTGRGQPVPGDQRPHPTDLLRRHPVDGQWRGHRRPAGRPADAAASADHERERVGVLRCCRWRGQRRQLVAEVRDQLRHSPATSTDVPRPVAGTGPDHLVPRRRGRPTPSGMQAAAKPESWAKSSRSG